MGERGEQTNSPSPLTIDRLEGSKAVEMRLENAQLLTLSLQLCAWSIEEEARLGRRWSAARPSQSANKEAERRRGQNQHFGP